MKVTIKDSDIRQRVRLQIEIETATISAVNRIELLSSLVCGLYDKIDYASTVEVEL